MKGFKNYLSLIKFAHTIFAMPFALIGFALGVQANHLQYGEGGPADYSWFANRDGGPVDPDSWPLGVRASLHIFSESGLGWGFFYKLVFIVLCMIFARSAAMAFNRYLDRKWDALNPRTAIREIPKGIISPRQALFFTIITSVLFIVCSGLLNPLCLVLSPLALAVVLGYSYTKRFTPLCHLILGVGLSLAPIGAYVAVTNEFAILPILFSVAVVTWVSGFDIIYALQDVDFDKSQQLYSIPAWLGKKRALHVSEVLHIVSALTVIAAGYYGEFGILYWLGVGVFCGCLIYQHAIVKHDDLRRVNLAFMTTNGIASVVFAVFVIADIILA